jgi:hypothetical protein
VARIIAGTIGVILLVIASAWLFGGFAGMTERGDVALVLGIIATVGLSVALMTLVFYSSRAGQDDTADRAILQENESADRTA